MASSSLGDLLGGLAGQLPFAVVSVVGIVAALARWRLHPRVSALVAGTLAVSLAASVLLSIGMTLATDRQFAAEPPSGDVVVLYSSLVGVIGGIVGAIAWAAMLVAAFGWRPAPPGYAASHVAGLQFTIRSLMLLTLAVALLSGAFRGVVMLMGNESVLLASWANQLPKTICWLIGARLAVVRWHWHAEISRLVLAAIAISFVVQLLPLVVLLWLTRASVLNPGMILLLGILNFLGSLLAATAWALLIAAALGWRQPPEAGEELLPVGGLARDASG